MPDAIAVFGVGGISNRQDVKDYLKAGASAVHAKLIPVIAFPLRVAIAAGLYNNGLLPGRVATWYINRLADKVVEQERRVVWAAANLAAWPNRLERGAA